MATVQVFGKQGVIDALKNINTPAWAIFSGTSMFMKWEENDINASEQALERALEMLQEAGTAAVYKIKFFEIPEKAAKLKITERSLCDAGSFNFKLQEQSEVVQGYNTRVVQIDNTTAKLDKLLEIVTAQQQQIAQLQEDIQIEEVEEKEETIGTVLIDAIKNPNKLMELVNTFKMITGIGMNYQPTGAIGNIPAAPVTTEPGNNEQLQPSEVELIARIDRLGAAINRLEKSDPLLVEHLEKLADISENDPGMFKFLLSRL